jgi:hypothetical protein
LQQIMWRLGATETLAFVAPVEPVYFQKTEPPPGML